MNCWAPAPNLLLSPQQSEQTVIELHDVRAAWSYDFMSYEIVTPSSMHGCMKGGLPFIGVNHVPPPTLLLTQLEPTYIRINTHPCLYDSRCKDICMDGVQWGNRGKRWSAFFDWLPCMRVKYWKSNIRLACLVPSIVVGNRCKHCVVCFL